MAKMGKGKSWGPDELPIEAIQLIFEYKHPQDKQDSK